MGKAKPADPANPADPADPALLLVPPGTCDSLTDEMLCHKPHTVLKSDHSYRTKQSCFIVLRSDHSYAT